VFLIYPYYSDAIGGDLVQVLGDRVGALAPKNPPKCEIGGDTAGTHCLLETNVGSVLSCIDVVYITIYFTF